MQNEFVFQEALDLLAPVWTSSGTEISETAKMELTDIFCSSFGNPVRLDFGTGHECSFAIFLFCLFKLKLLEEDTHDPFAVLGIFKGFVLAISFCRLMCMFHCLSIFLPLSISSGISFMYICLSSYLYHSPSLSECAMCLIFIPSRPGWAFLVSTCFLARRRCLLLVVGSVFPFFFASMLCCCIFYYLLADLLTTGLLLGSLRLLCC